MTNLKIQFETTNLDELCNSLTQEITGLATAEYKLKLVFVLVHIIEECQKALNFIDTENLINDFKALVEKACKKSEMQEKALNGRFSCDNKLIMNIIDERNDELQNLYDEIDSKLKQFNKLAKQLARKRDEMEPEEVIRQSKH